MAQQGRANPPRSIEGRQRIVGGPFDLRDSSPRSESAGERRQTLIGHSCSVISAQSALLRGRRYLPFGTIFLVFLLQPAENDRRLFGMIVQGILNHEADVLVTLFLRGLFSGHFGEQIRPWWIQLHELLDSLG